MIAESAPLGIVRSCDDLLAIMRRRAEDLGLTRVALDSLARLTPGLAGKLLAPQPLKKLNPEYMAFLLPALGMQLVAVEDLDAVEIIRNRGHTREAVKALHAGTVQITLSNRHMSRIRKLGGWNSRKYLTPAKRKALARKAAFARWRAKIPGKAKT